jgi:hypothetical protein
LSSSKNKINRPIFFLSQIIKLNNICTRCIPHGSCGLSDF